MGPCPGTMGHLIPTGRAGRTSGRKLAVKPGSLPARRLKDLSRTFPCFTEPDTGIIGSRNAGMSFRAYVCFCCCYGSGVSDCAQGWLPGPGEWRPYRQWRLGRLCFGRPPGNGQGSSYAPPHVPSRASFPAPPGGSFPAQDRHRFPGSQGSGKPVTRDARLAAGESRRRSLPRAAARGGGGTRG